MYITRTKYLQRTGLIAMTVLALGLAVTSIAQAQDAGTEPAVLPAPIVLEVDGSGTAVVRGTVASVGTDVLTLTSWGGTWNIRTNEETVVVSGGTSGQADLATVSTGDLIGVEGVIASDAEMTVDATFIRNWTSDPYLGADAPGPALPPEAVLGDATAGTQADVAVATDSTDALDDSETEGAPDDGGMAHAGDAIVDEEASATSWRGTAVDVGYRSFTIVDDTGRTYEVELGSDAEVYTADGEDGVTIFGLDVDEDAEVDVSGTLEADGATITASEVRVR